MGIQEDICVRVGNSYVPIDFMVVDTGNDERSPIILGRPFLNTTGAVMYANTAKIIFNIRGKRETFFKNRVLQFPAHPHQQNNQKKKTVDKKNKTKTKKTKKMKTVRMVTAVHMEHDHMFKSPHLIKKDDPGVLTIQCSINRSSFNKAVCDKVTYEYLYGTMHLEPTYAQLQIKHSASLKE
jgi:hypothetical protein